MPMIAFICNLVDFLCRQPSKDAYVIDRGYQLDYLTSRVFEYNRLSEICGSTIILSKNVTGVANDDSFDEFQKCFWFSKHHDIAKNYFGSNQLKVGNIPFKALQYIFNTKINLSNELRKNYFKNYIKRIVKFWIIGRHMTLKEQKSFGYFFSNLNLNH